MRSRDIKINQSVTYIGGELKTRLGKQGVVRSKPINSKVTVLFEGEGRAIVVNVKNLRPVPAVAASPNMIRDNGFANGDRVRYTGRAYGGTFSDAGAVGATGTVDDTVANHRRENVPVRWDARRGPLPSRGVLPDNLTLITRAAAALIANPKDEAAEQLRLGYEQAKEGDKNKKAAKSTLTGLGVIPENPAPGREVIYDSKSYRITAETAEGRPILDEQKLRDALLRYLPSPTLNLIFKNATGQAKNATTYKVEKK